VIDPPPDAEASSGVGPHPEPWPPGAHLDADLLARGDGRNVVDRYRYWKLEAIVGDLDRLRHGFHVAIENWEHDFNIGTVVRNANAFLAARVHIIGERRWDRRGAKSTHRYQRVDRHPDFATFAAWAHAHGLPIVAFDNVAGSVPIESASLPEACALLFGQEGPGLSAEALAAASIACEISQYGSTRSLNAGVASGVAMYAWCRQHASPAR
jgi:tRNA G18 (ribose-2'-O)-methylase SpoU